MNTFLRNLILSLTQASYYGEVLQSRISFSVKYYLALSLLLTIISAGVGTIKLAPVIKSHFADISQEILQNYPRELVLNIKPNEISANQKFPLIFPTPDSLRKSDTTLPQNLAIIDPQGEIEMLQKHDSLMLINNSYLIVESDNNIQTAPLKDFPDTRIDYSVIQQTSQILIFIAQNAYPLTASFFIFFGLFDFFVLRTIYLAVFALGLWFTYRNSLGTYSKAFQFSLHSITLPLLINVLLGIAEIALPVPFWFAATHIVFTFYILSRLEKTA